MELVFKTKFLRAGLPLVALGFFDMQRSIKHGCETNLVVYSTKIARRTYSVTTQKVSVIGTKLRRHQAWGLVLKTVALLIIVFGTVADTQAQIPQDPYPRFGQIFLAQKPTAQGPILQGPTLQGPAVQGPVLDDAATQDTILQGPILQGLTIQSSVIQAPLAQEPQTVPQWQPDSQAFRIYGPQKPKSSQSTPINQFGRSKQLERIAQDADRHTQKAFELASRGAHFSARAELVRALRLIAQGLDSQRQCRAYSGSLRAGLKALEEVDDFIPTGSQLESDLPLREIIARHQTKVLKAKLDTTRQMAASEDRPELSSDFSQKSSPLLPTPMEAVGAYLRYAQEQLSIATGGEVAGSMALHGLGKLYAARPGSELNISISQAIVCFNAATTVCPQNYLAQNDLGVLLARTGRTDDARQVFEKSILIRPHPTTMGNLTVVYKTLGRNDLAEKTKKYLAAYKKSGAFPSKSTLMVDWVSPEKFSESYAKTPDARQLSPIRRPGDTPAKQPAVKQAGRTWPWNWKKR